VEIEFEKGDPVAIDGVKLSPASLLTKLNEVRRQRVMMCEGGEGGSKWSERVGLVAIG
jgi:hypothetical protein